MFPQAFITLNTQTFKTFSKFGANRSTLKHYLKLLLIIIPTVLQGQAPASPDAAEIFKQIQKLGVLGNVLYVAAHPDDENTRVIAYLSNGKLVNTGYLSMTRGDGGQNDIGPEIREQLGIIRTQELLAARRLDGGQQFFTRASDFGYSKTTEETQRIWEWEKVLGDVVWRFRNFRPDVVLLRFPPDSRAGHGHHTTSAILALEAFKISGDPKAYPEQLEYVDTWQPRRIYMNTGRWWRTNISADEEGVVTMDVGEFDPTLGTSYAEISAQSRSQHKSQGFGASGSRGQLIEYMELQDGDDATNTIFDDIDISWGRVEGGQSISRQVEEIITSFEPGKPYESIDQLISLREAVAKLKDTYWRDVKIREIDNLLLACAGIYVEATASAYQVVPGDSLQVRVEYTNRSPADVQLEALHVQGDRLPVKAHKMEYNDRNIAMTAVQVPETQKISNPYWLNEKGSLGMYAVERLQDIGKPENDPSFTSTIELMINGTLVRKQIPVVYRWTDRVKGELRRRVEVIPPVMVSMEKPVVIFADNHPQRVRLMVTAGKENVRTDVSLDIPPGWRMEPASQEVTIDGVGMERMVDFVVYPPDGASDVMSTAVAAVDGTPYSRSIKIIDYDHIPIQTLFPVAQARFVRLDIKKAGVNIGYLQGAGDAVPESLRSIGYNVWEMSMDDITSENMESLDAFIVGIRAVNMLPDLRNKKDIILSYAKNGGNVIYQYNKSQVISWEVFAPYRIGFTGNSSDSRVSVEEAEIRVLEPTHQVLNEPNKITSDDFEGWVQERGLYFPNTWAPEFEAILSSNDPGEDPKNGGLLVASYGEGHFVYTGYSWFRQLPAGVPGAFRLFANIISLGNTEKPNNAKIASDNE